MPTFSMSVWIVSKYYHFCFGGGRGAQRTYDCFILGLEELTQLDEEFYVTIKAKVPKIFTLFVSNVFGFCWNPMYSAISVNKSKFEYNIQECWSLQWLAQLSKRY
jgi:hypothetical protein